MSDMQSTLGRTLLTSMIKTREKKGDITLQDVGGIFINMASSLNPNNSVADNFVHQEIAKLAKYIGEAKNEIFAIQSNAKAEDAIEDASMHLEEVVKATEQATNTIMDAADAIQAAAGGIGGDKEQAIMDKTTVIYDACAFQDITGQRIRKVITLLENIEDRVEKLNNLFGTEAPKSDEAAPVDIKTIDPKAVVLPKDDKDLLNGPQLSGAATSQADIDRLLAGFG
ncbi:MAG: protein phosphatase CheZ [Rickettsiales bacterium]